MDFKLPVIIFAISLLATYLYKFFANYLNIVDGENSRTSHVGIVPRGGGIVFPLIFLALPYVANISLLEKNILITVILFATIGFLDDLISLPGVLRLVLQFILSISFSYFLYQNYELNILLLPLISLALSWSVNLFNFMDGTDGLAAMQAIGFTVGFGIIFWIEQNTALVSLATVLFAVLLAFLSFNWPQAKLFMGDAGSYFLGGLIGVLSISSSIKYKVDFTVWLILYSPFWFDATITLIRRVYNKENFLGAHRKHAYQRLQQMGWSHAKILLSFIVVLGALNFIAIASYVNESCIIGLGLSLIILCLIYYKIEQRAPMFN